MVHAPKGFGGCGEDFAGWLVSFSASWCRKEPHFEVMPLFSLELYF